ncbi:MAG: hypothetical protein UV05_C0026G0001, partial [candidate division CPR1 bacterium GW2011_GWA2_42_17]
LPNSDVYMFCSQNAPPCQVVFYLEVLHFVLELTYAGQIRLKKAPLKAGRGYLNSFILPLQAQI